MSIFNFFVNNLIWEILKVKFDNPIGVDCHLAVNYNIISG